MNRRGFLGCATTLGTLAALAPRSVFAADDYRALVCIFLFGGNDGLNMVVPVDARYDDYAAARGGAVAVPRASLLPLAGGAVGLHPGMQRLQAMYGEGRLAIVANVGPLTRPVTKDAYLSRTAELPLGLGAHDAQQQTWQSGLPQSPSTTGWAGRLADTVPDSTVLPTCLGLAGVNLLQVGARTRALQLDPAGPGDLLFGTNSEVIRGALARIARQSAQNGATVFERSYAATFERAREKQAIVRDALAKTPAITTRFPDNRLGQQLQMVARLIAARHELGARRQVYFVQDGGYDTHDEQAKLHPKLLANLSDSIGAFQAALDETGASPYVAGFTASDFGRRIDGNGDGTDHGWGSHHFVFGTPVRGGQVVGELPELGANGPEVADGLLIPRLAVDQYVAPMCRWFGVDEATLAATVLPNLPRFAPTDLPLFA